MSLSSPSNQRSSLNKKVIHVGSRASSLALIQTELVVSRLSKVYGDEYDFEIHTMKTIGDKILEKPLPEIGDKGLFTQELEEALLSNRVDFIVHSLKDLPTSLPDGCCIGAILEREDPCDVIVLKKGLQVDSASDLIYGKFPRVNPVEGDASVTIGTSSLRRQSQVRRMNPNAIVKDVRGNLTTRLEKLDGLKGNVSYDALILASSGLKRAGFQDRISFLLGDDNNDFSSQDKQLIPWLYAVGQGALAIECRSNDDLILTLLKPITDHKTVYEILAERSLLMHLEGGCSVPIGVQSSWSSYSDLLMTAAIFSVDGKTRIDGKSSVKLNRSHLPTESDEDKEIAHLKKKRKLSVHSLDLSSQTLLSGLLIPKDCPVLQSNYESCFKMGKDLAEQLSNLGGASLLKDIKDEKEKKRKQGLEGQTTDAQFNTSSSSDTS